MLSHVQTGVDQPQVQTKLPRSCPHVTVVIASIRRDASWTTQRSFTDFLDQSDEAKLRGATAEKSGTKSWKVKCPSFPGTTAVFSRKGGHRTHPLHTTEGVNAINDKVRVKDFQDRVLVSHRFALFPGVETETNALPFGDFRMKTTPGRGLRITTLGKNRALRRWIDENLL